MKFSRAQVAAFASREWGLPAQLQTAELLHWARTGQTLRIIEVMQLLFDARIAAGGQRDVRQEEEDFAAHVRVRKAFDALNAHRLAGRDGTRGGTGQSEVASAGARASTSKRGRRHRGRSSVARTR